MTEGAKTGTLSDKLSRHIETEMEAEQGMMESAARRCLHTDACYHQGKKAALEEVKEWLRENKDDTLTEALKVAGELAEGALALADLAERNTDDTDEWEAAIGRVRSLAALERIRNKG